MVFQEPKVEFVPIDLNGSILASSNCSDGRTSTCTDGITDGGTYCNDSSVTTDCGNPMAATN